MAKHMNKARTLNKQVAMAKRKGNKAKTLNKQVAMAKKMGTKHARKLSSNWNKRGAGNRPEASGGRAALV